MSSAAPRLIPENPSPRRAGAAPFLPGCSGGRLELPDYLPESARRFFDSKLRDGFEQALELARHRIRVHRPVADSVDQRELECAAELAAHLEREVALLTRLARDARMQGVYTHLLSEGVNAADFLRAAWAAARDYGEASQELRAAKRLAGEIASLADQLSSLLQQANLPPGVLLPREFFDVRALLYRATPAAHARGRFAWGGSRLALLGNVGAEGAGNTEQRAEWEHLERLWRDAPELSALLTVLAGAARQFTPAHQDNAVAAADRSRKKNPRAAYLRALFVLLSANGVSVGCRLHQAIADTTDVVLNDPDVSTSADDVRKAMRLPEGSC